MYNTQVAEHDLIALGLSETEAKALVSPLSKLDADGRNLAFAAGRKRDELVRKANEKHKSSFRGHHYVITDDTGPKGWLCHADGKIYSSKSKYYQAVKDNGCVVVGGADAPKPKQRQMRGNFDNSKELREAIQQHLN